MINEIVEQLKKSERTNKTLKIIRYGINPFMQQPPLQKEEEVDRDNCSASLLNADELFSLFTADIIKEKVIFTR